ncbi:hypothetical protein BS21228_21165 [Bacillus subtilis]|nr:hypothetical protein BS21228_21165 [Bacillus subtilis]
MDVNYLYSNVFVFLLMSKNKKAENSVKIYATLVIKIRKISLISELTKEDHPEKLMKRYNFIRSLFNF